MKQITTCFVWLNTGLFYSKRGEQKSTTTTKQLWRGGMGSWVRISHRDFNAIHLPLIVLAAFNLFFFANSRITYVFWLFFICHTHFGLTLKPFAPSLHFELIGPLLCRSLCLNFRKIFVRSTSSIWGLSSFILT